MYTHTKTMNYKVWVDISYPFQTSKVAPLKFGMDKWFHPKLNNTILSTLASKWSHDSERGTWHGKWPGSVSHLRLSKVSANKRWIYINPSYHVFVQLTEKWSLMAGSLYYNIDGLAQERRNSSASAMNSRLSCMNPLICRQFALSKTFNQIFLSMSRKICRTCKWKSKNFIKKTYCFSYIYVYIYIEM